MKLKAVLLYLAQLITISLGAFSTIFITEYYSFSSVISSSLCTLVFVLLGYKWHAKLKLINGLFFVGSFIGMTSTNKLSLYYEILFACFIATIINKIIEKHFLGFGGKMGAIAFLSTSITYLIFGIVL